MIYLKYILGLLLISLGILSSSFIEFAEIPIYINYLSNWTFSLLIAHFIPSIFIILGVISIISNQTKLLCYVLSTFFAIYVYELYTTNVLNLGKTEIIIFSSVLLLSLTMLFLFKKSNLSSILIKHDVYRKITMGILVTFALFVPYIMSPIANYALIDNPKEEINKKNIKLLNKYISLDKLKNDSTTTLVALFSTNCYYCFNAAKRIGITQRENNFCKIISVFPSNIEEIDQFINDANYSTNKIQCSKKDFLKLSKGRYPMYFLIKDKISKYDASSFQHRTIDLLSNL